MTDFEKVKTLFTELGIGYEVEGNRIICEEGNAKIEGYLSFCAAFEFDEKGKFIKMELFE